MEIDGKRKIRWGRMLLICLCVTLGMGTPASAYAKKVALNKKSVVMVVKDKYTLKLKGTSRKPKWSVSNKKVVSVSSKGRLTAKKAGKAIVTAKMKGKKYKCKVTVKKSPVISKKSATLAKGKTLTLKLKYTVSTPSWKSDNTKIVKVSKKGVVTALKKGTANVTAKLRGKKYKCKITVTQKGESKKQEDSKKQIMINGKPAADGSAELYAIDEDYQTVLKIPSDCKQSFQIKVSGNKTAPDFRVISGKSVKVDQNGNVTPREEIWYWNGNFGSTWPSGAEGERKVIEYNYGKSVVQAKIDGQTYKFEVTLHNYVQVYADNVLDDFIQNNLDSAMTQTDKINKITEYVAHNYDYSASYSGYISMILFGGGDCWASTSMILELCERVGIPARLHYVNGNAMGRHRNVVALADGEVYELEAGYTGTAPRIFNIKKLEQGYSYSVKDGKAYLNEYEGFGTPAVRIPESINGYPVAGIGENLFYGCVVYGNVSITEVDIPACVTDIVPKAFYAGDTDITKVVVAADNPSYCDVDGVLYSKDKTSLYYVPSKKTGKLVLDANVQRIEKYAVSYCKGLTEVVLGNQVSYIGEAAFWRCSQLSQINLPASLTNIGIGAFSGAALTKVTVPKTVSELPDGCFQDCTKLELTVENPGAVFGEEVVASNAVIYGYAGSTAEAYAKQWDITFRQISQ